MTLDLRDIETLVANSNFRDALSRLDSTPDSGITDEGRANVVVLRVAALNGLGRWRESLTVGSNAVQALLASAFREQAARLCGYLGVAYMRTGSITDAESHYRAAIHLLSWELGDSLESLRQQKRLALMFHGLGLWPQARFEMEKAIGAADRCGATHLAGTLRINLAITCTKSGDLSRASDLLESATSLLTPLGNEKCLLQLDLVRANIQRITGRTQEALDTLSRCTSIALDHEYQREQCISLEYRGDCYISMGRSREALENYSRAMEIAERIAPDGDLIPELCHRLAEAMVHLGETNGAIVCCERGLRVARAISDRYEECATYRVYALAHRAAGNQTKALRIIDEGIDLSRRYEMPYELGRMLAWAGERRLESPNAAEQLHGQRQLGEARGIFERMELGQMVRSVDDLLGLEQETREVMSSVESDPDALRFGIVTCNRNIRESVTVLASVASSQIPVLITGESGVGKELLAQALHQMSARRRAPFVPVNCAAISTSLLDSELFGHERGAFTGAVTTREGLVAASDRGTLFLDEVGDLPLQMQAALLRVLETGEVRAIGRDDIRKVDIRIVAATNASLEDLVARGTFRRDLFYRLNGIRVNVPPLREREEDIVALFRHFWGQACASARKRLKLDERVEGVLCSYAWPGNVRELRHEIARAVALAQDGSTVGPDAFLTHLKSRDTTVLRRERDRNEVVLGERQQIVTALRAHRGNKAEAARSLGGMKRTTLIYKMERLGIRPEEYLQID